MEVEFTQSARRHRIGRTRVLQALAYPIAVVEVDDERAVGKKLLILGKDQTGRALEIIAVLEDENLIVIHAMDLRPKFRGLYEEGKRS